MKTILLLATALLINLSVFSQSCPPTKPLKTSEVTGQWQGSYSTAGSFIKFTLKISEASDQLVASVNIPSEKLQNIVYEAEICNGQELHLINSSLSSSIEFIGRPNAQGILSGRVIFREPGKEDVMEVFTLKRV